MRLLAVFGAALLSCGTAHAESYCAAPYSDFFACDIPERGARVEFCRIMEREEITVQTPEYRHTYREHGQVQLTSDTDKAISTAASGIRGISGDALTTGFDNAGTIHAAYPVSGRLSRTGRGSGFRKHGRLPEA